MKTILLLIAALLLISHPCCADTFTYDALNRLTHVGYDNGNSVDFSYDAAGNITQVAKVGDFAAPSIPTGLAATPASATQVNLTWTASTDDVAVTGYRVYRNSVLVGSPVGESYDDTGLTAATGYTYTVAACDAAANCSAQSAATAATTNKTPQSITFDPAPSLSYGGGTASVSATGGLSGLPVTFTSLTTDVCTISSSTVTPVSAGICIITASQAGNGNYLPATAQQTLNVARAGATITLDNATLAQDHDGTARSVIATTNPAGLSYSVTYSGSPTPPTAVGSYAISATITAANYQGSSSGTLIISDKEKPRINSFSALPRTNYLIADITINASDNLLVIGYCLTEGVDSSVCSWSANAPASYTFATPGPKTLTAYVKDAAGNISTGHGSTFTVTIPTLTVTVSGTGSGTVTSAPVGIACTTGSCANSFSGTVNLYATPSALSLFGGWSGGVCSGTALACSVTMNGTKSVIATFTPAPLLHIDGTPYASLQAAYDAATGGAVIQLLESTTAGTLNANRNITVKLKGGYNAAYSATPDETTVTGPLRIRQGKVVADKVNVR